MLLNLIPKFDSDTVFLVCFYHLILIARLGKS